MSDTCLLGLITARAGSKGLPGKHLLPLAGKPLLAWTCDAARTAQSLDRAVLSTNDAELAACAREHGIEVPFMRPNELAADASPHIDVVIHALDWLAEHDQYEPSHVCLLQPTSPLRVGSDIDAAWHLLRNHDAPAVVGVTEAATHPYFSYAIHDDQQLKPFVQHDLAYARRQDLPPAYAINGAIYIIDVQVLREAGTFIPDGTVGYLMPRDRSIDIDSALDLAFAEAVLKLGLP